MGCAKLWANNKDSMDNALYEILEGESMDLDGKRDISFQTNSMTLLDTALDIDMEENNDLSTILYDEDLSNNHYMSTPNMSPLSFLSGNNESKPSSSSSDPFSMSPYFFGKKSDLFETVYEHHDIEEIVSTVIRLPSNSLSFLFSSAIQKQILQDLFNKYIIKGVTAKYPFRGYITFIYINIFS